MTEQTPQADPQPVDPAPVVVDLATAGPDDRLAALYNAYPAAKAEADEAGARLKAVTDGIKALTTALSDDLTKTPKFELRGGSGTPLALRWQVSSRFDSKAFCAASPANAAAYDAFKKPSGTWVLAPIKGGE